MPLRMHDTTTWLACVGGGGGGGEGGRREREETERKKGSKKREQGREPVEGKKEKQINSNGKGIGILFYR